MDQNNGGIIGKINTPTTSVASGVWSLDSQFESQAGSTWPLAFPQTTIANSCRFDDGSSDYLNRTPSGAGNRRTFTISCWVKRGQTTTNSFLFSAWTADNDAGHFSFGFESAERLTVDTYSTNLLTTTRVFKDPSAWYNVVCAVDTTSGTADNRVRLYVNGVEQSNYSTRNNPSQNADLQANNSVIQVVGANYYNSQANVTHDGYIAEFYMIDGQQLTPTSFGATNPVTNIWEPIAYTGTYGTNGFKLNFTDSSNLGDDTSGNGNDFTVNNLTSIDQSTDTCSNNFATLNPLNIPTSNKPTFSDGNLTSITNSSTGSYKWGGCSTIGVTKGKWYCEAKATVDSTYSRNVIGITGNATELARTNASILNATYSWGYYSSNGTVQGNGSGDISGYSTSYTTGDIVGVAMDLDNNKLYFSKNGTFLNSGDPTSGSTGTGAISIVAASTTTDGAYFFAQTDDTGTSSPSKFEFNFGSPPYSISSGNADANGFGNFEYAVPSGYFALNTKNLAEYG